MVFFFLRCSVFLYSMPVIEGFGDKDLPALTIQQTVLHDSFFFVNCSRLHNMYAINLFKFLLSAVCSICCVEIVY